MQPNESRGSISVITEENESEVLTAFDWDRDYGGLYRQCPSAFWLAPDGGLPAKAFDLSPRSPDPVEVAALKPASLSISNRFQPATLAVLAAGPICLAALVLGDILFGSDPSRLGLLLIGLPFAIMIGSLAALAPVALGSAILGELGRTLAPARERGWWGVTGGLMGLALAAVFDARWFSVPLVITSVACALIAHHGVVWEDRDGEAATPHAISA